MLLWFKCSGELSFFVILAHIEAVERIFSLLNVQWTSDRNRLFVECVMNLLIVSCNYKDLTCSQYYSNIKSRKDFLKKVGRSEKWSFLKNKLLWFK